MNVCLSSRLTSRSRPGFALVIVLGFLVLITVLVVAFFSSVTTDRASTKLYSDGAATRQLADSAVQVVMGQIKAATTGANVIWASQPGMIRNFDATGSPATNYKLYSSSAMTIAGPLSLTQVGDYDSAWSTKPAGWTDLNAPVTDAAGKINFPVIDGNNIKSLTQDAAGHTVPAYLSYDAINNASGAPGPDGLPDVAGFSVDPQKVTFDPSKPPSISNTPVPVPVRWLYQLRDGTLAAPDDASTASATFVNSTIKPSLANPIVGRVAFWTDDETAKVNLNTAGEGSYWDTPHFSSSVIAGGSVLMANANVFPDYGYAAFQPARFEFQRYPGHPAQVAVSTIFPGLLGQDMAGLTPRLVWGGTLGGTVYAGRNTTTGQTPTINLALAPRQALYASLDELQFSQKTPQAPEYLRVANGIASEAAQNPLTKDLLEKAKFFLTTDSRAPEVNLFDKPRVCIWPIHQDLATNAGSPYTTAYDRLIAFCSTLGGPSATAGPGGVFRYFFQRANSQSPTSDYLNIPENQKLYAYLQALMAQPEPGFASTGSQQGSFLTKYGVDSDQILTEIFDYIRCTNLADPSLSLDPSDPSGNTSTLSTLGMWGKGPYQYSNYQLTSDGEFYCGQVTPLQIDASSTMGLGRYYTVKDVSIVFACTGDGRDGPMPPASLATPSIYQQSNDTSTNVRLMTYNPTLAGTALKTTEKRVQMAVLLNYFCPHPANSSAGLTCWSASVD